MAGLMRVVRGVTASGENGNIGMDAADMAAAKIPSLSIGVSMGLLRDNGAGQLAGKDIAFGANLTKLASGGTFTPIASSSAFNNKPVLRVAGEAGIDIERKAPISQSFITLMVASFSADTLDDTASHRILNLYDSAGTRKGGITLGANNSINFSPTTTTMTAYPLSNFTADVPFIMAFQWNEVTHTARVYKNSLVTTVVGAVNNAVTNNVQPTDYYAIWKTNQALRSVGGDYAKLYHFNSALRDGNESDRLLLQNCWDALKTLYGIA